MAHYSVMFKKVRTKSFTGLFSYLSCLLPLSQGFSFNDILERAFKVNCKGLKVLLLLLLSPVPKFFNEGRCSGYGLALQLKQSYLRSPRRLKELELVRKVYYHW